MKTIKTSVFSVLIALFCVKTFDANAMSPYANNVGATNINMMTEQMMNYAHRGEDSIKNISDESLYGKMKRADEYGNATSGGFDTKTLCEKSGGKFDSNTNKCECSGMMRWDDASESCINLCDYFSKHKNEASAKRLACCRFGNQTKWIGDDYDGSCYCTEENLEFNYDPKTKRATCDGQLYYNVDADIDEAIAMQQKSCREIGSAAKWTGYTCVCKDSDMVYSYDKETKTGKCIENTKKEKLAKDIIDDENEILATNIWADYRYLNVKSNYGSNNIDERSRIHMGAVGFDSKNFDTGAGDLAFGGFIGYANQNMMDFTSDGYFVGFFTKYNYGMFGLTGMVTNGALMNSSDIHRFDNSWTNAAMDMSLKIKTYRSLYFQPMIYGGYTHVSTDRLRINNVPTVPEDSFTFWNVAPSVKIGALLSDHLYGAISGKYVMTYGDKNKDLYVNDVLTDRTTAKDYGEFGLNLEYNLDGVIFGVEAYKLTNGFDGWSGNINVKYVF